MKNLTNKPNVFCNADLQDKIESELALARVINEKIEQLNQQITVLCEEIRKEVEEYVFNHITADVFNVNPMFQLVKCEYERNRIRFYAEDYCNEIFKINFRENYLSDSKGDFDIELSYYMTTCNSDFEFKRLILLGRLSDWLMLNKRQFKDDIIEIKENIEKIIRNLQRENDCLKSWVNTIIERINGYIFDDILTAVQSKDGISFCKGTKLYKKGSKVLLYDVDGLTCNLSSKNKYIQINVMSAGVIRSTTKHVEEIKYALRLAHSSGGIIGYPYYNTETADTNITGG